MNKCRLCQEISNNLTILYNNRLKSLAQIILKLKGFKDSWDTTNDLAICEQCIEGVENVALFWENIPEAKKETADIAGQLKEQNATASLRMEQTLPALTLEADGETGYETSSRTEEKLEPIKLRIKLPGRTRKKKLDDTSSTSLKQEPLGKRLRRCPQRYNHFQLTSTQNTLASTDSSTRIQNSDACNETCFTDLPQIALLRLENGQNIGTLAEVESQGLACRIRISCQICWQIFRLEKAFQEHLKSHCSTDLQHDNLTNYLYHCILCDKSFANHRAVRNHFKLAHSNERHFKCLHCEASFKYKFNLNYHISTKHIDKKPFECTFCKKRFCMRYELQIHVRTHTKERPYKCELCPLAFAHKSNLKQHQRHKHFENSTETAFPADCDNSEKSTIPVKQFIPPEYLIENESIVYSASLRDTVITEEETALPSEELQQNVVQCDSVDQSAITSEQIKPTEVLLELDNHSLYLLNDRNMSNSPILKNVECFTGILEENSETTATKIMFGAEETSETAATKTMLGSVNSINTNIESASNDQSNLGDTKISRIPTLNDNSEVLLNGQPIMGVFQLDSSLLKYLPSASLLGLKKWPKSFQSTPTNQLQLVKSSTFIHNKNIGNFEMNKTLANFKETCETLVEDSLGTTDQQFSSIHDYNTRSNLPQAVPNLNSSSLNSATNYCDVSQAQNESISTLTNPWEQNNLRDINNLKNGEVILNNQSIKMPRETNAAQPWKEIKVSTRPVKVKYKTNSNQSSTTSNLATAAGHKSFTSKEVLANKALTNSITSTNENLKPSFQLVSSTLTPFEIVSPTTVQSLLKPVVKEPQAPAMSLSFTSPSLNRTLSPNKPLITNIEILPPLQMLTTLQKSPTTANLIKPPAEYKFQCHYCYKYFKQKSPLTKHLRTHTGEKPYKCNLCPKSYADASNYKKHKTLHKNAAEALNISGKTTAYAVQSSPAYSTVSDPDPDGIEVMQTLKKFECSSTEDDDMDENDSDSSNMESQMWHDALDHALNSEEIRSTLRINLMGINDAAALPKSRQHVARKIENPD